MATNTTSQRASGIPGISLIIESPRFGTHGHRFIVPFSVHDEGLVAQRVEAAARNLRGRDTIAVRRPVEQRLESGAVRQGYEIILLHGVQTRDLDERRLGTLEAALEALWPRVDELVEELTPQASRQRGLLLRDERMQTWANGLQDQFDLRATEPQHSPKRTFRIALSAIAVLVFAMLGFWFVDGQEKREGILCKIRDWIPQTNQIAGDVSHGAAEQTEVEKQLKTLAERWQSAKCGDESEEITPEKIAKEIWIAANWDDQIQVNTAPSYEDILKNWESDKDIKAWLKQIVEGSPAGEDSQGSDPLFAFIPDNEPQSPNGELLKKLAAESKTEGDLVCLRRNLYGFMNKLVEIGELMNDEKIEDWRDFVSKESYFDIFDSIIVSSRTNLKLPEPKVPSTPVFSIQDLEIAEIVREFVANNDWANKWSEIQRQEDQELSGIEDWHVDQIYDRIEFVKINLEKCKEKIEEEHDELKKQRKKNRELDLNILFDCYEVFNESLDFLAKTVQ